MKVDDQGSIEDCNMITDYKESQSEFDALQKIKGKAQRKKERYLCP